MLDRALMFTALLLGAAPLAGCGELDRDAFIEQAAPLSCKNERRCYRGHYEATYDDLDDCVSDLEDQYDDVADLFENLGCDWEPDKAAECLAAMRTSTCEEWYDGDHLSECDELYDC